MSGADRLIAVAEHARAHGLDTAMTTVGVAGDRIRVYLASGGSMPHSTADFVRWARSIGATDIVDAAPARDRRQFEALGHLDSGDAVTVLVSVYLPGDAPAFLVPLSQFEECIRCRQPDADHADTGAEFITVCPHCTHPDPLRDRLERRK